MEKIRREVFKCSGCRLGSTKKNFVFGEGSLEASVMFIGEGPGEDEDISGRPFVGKAGQLLTKIIENGMKIPRESVYIANVVKCRPPSNRDPLPDEAAACIGYLKKQIEIINPKVIVLLGKVAAKHLLGLETTITKARESTYSYGDIKVFVTYHPSALLRNENYKRPVWEDIKKVMNYLETVQRP
ncbi:MAG TPA: uracil-DNA glycosylase [bacterium]|nr:uracil-DNA glycosylase [bacterium]